MPAPLAYVIPGRGLMVRDPVTMEALPAEGAAKPLTTYWRRRLKDGDVTQGKPPRRPKED